MSFADDYFNELNKNKKKKKENEQSSSNNKTVLDENNYAAEYFNALTEGAKDASYTTAPTFTRVGADDIAPVRDTSGYFQKSALFDDGYQRWDVTKTAGATLGDVGENAIKGGANWLEKMWDGMLTLGTAMNRSALMQSAQSEIMLNAISGKKESASEILDRYNKMQEGAEKATAEYVAKDIIKEEKIDFGVDEYSVLGEKSDALVQSGSELLLRQAVSAIPGVGVPLAYASTGLSVLGGEAENAFNQDATFNEALASGVISAGAEMGTEALFGLKIGKTTLSDGLVKKLTSTIPNKVAATLAKWGINAVGEGVEEDLSGYISAVGQELTYLSEKEINEIYTSEDHWDNFLGGVILGGFFEGVSIPIASKKGIDYVTGLGKNEKKVIDKVYNDAVAEKEKTKGKKLTTNEKTKIFDEVVERAEKGYISTDTIEEVLGGEDYKAYKENLDTTESLKTELEGLSNIERGKLTRNQEKRIAELEAMNLDDTTKSTELRKKLDDKLAPMLKNSRLVESYNEVARKGQAFQADLTQYTGKQREAVERAIKSGVLNNTNRSHELVDILSKLEADKGIAFDYTNNEKLKKSGFAVEGKVVNGFVKDGGVTLNVQSSKAWQSTVGHEITHVLEGTESYGALREALFSYAESKGELASRKTALTELYKGMDADIDAELTADLVGDYLFSNKDFINKLTGNRTLFQKVWDEVKYLCKVATGKELTEIEKVEREFANAWKTLSAESKVVGDATETGAVRLSVSPEEQKLGRETADFIESVSKMLDHSKISKRKLKIGAISEGHKEIVEKLMHKIKPDFSVDGYELWIDGTGAEHINARHGENGKADRTMASREDKELIPWAANTPDGGEFIRDEHGNIKLSDRYFNADGSKAPQIRLHKEIDGDMVYVAECVPDSKNRRIYITSAYKKSSTNQLLNIDSKESPQPTPEATFDSGATTNSLTHLSKKVNTKFSISTDSTGNELSLAVQKRFANSKAVDENGNLKVLYHGTASGEFYTFDKSKGSVEGDFGSGFYFTDSESDVEANYEDGGADFENKVARRAEQIESEEDIDYSEAEARAREELYKGGFKHSVYLNIENPAIVGKTNLFDYESFAEEYDRNDYDSDEDYEGDVEQLIADTIDEIIWDIDRNVDIYSTDGIANVLWEAVNEGGIDVERLKANINNLYLEDNNGNLVGNEVTRQIIESLGYDGIIDNTVSTKFNMNLEEGTTHYIVFKPNQIKSIDNQNPTDNPDIRFSLSDENYQTAVDNNDLETAQLMVDKKAKENGYTVKAYHGTGRADRVGNVFLPERATSGPMAFFTDNKDIASNYARDKADTSLAYDEEYDSYYTQFRVNRNGKSISIPELWQHLSVSERNRIKEQAAHIKFDDDYETIIVDESAQHGNGAWDAYTLNSHRGNALEALVDTWLESGDLYNQEELFLEVLKNVGITDAEYRNPDARYEKVYDTWLKIQNPFDTDNANQSFYDSLSEWIDNNDMSVYEKESADADMWDKNNQTPESWLGKLEGDIESGTTHAWTVIPDFVTDYLKEQGYDGIKDKGGKGGGAGHTVWIPFSSEQVKSAEPITYDDNQNVIPLSQRFDSSKVDIRNSLSNEGEQFAPVGNYSTPLKETALEQDIAPVAKNVTRNVATTTEAPMPSNATPKSTRLADGSRSDELLVESLDNYPMETVEQKVAEGIRAIEGELADNRDLRREAEDNYDSQIAELRKQYNSKKNKDTKVAYGLLQSISRLERLKASTDAKFAKRISDLEARLEKMQTPEYNRAMYKQAKMEEHAKFAEALIGDTSTWVDKKLGLQYATNTERRNLRDIVRDENGNVDIQRADAINDALNGQYNRNQAEMNRKDNEISEKYRKLKVNRYESVYANMLGEFRHNPETTLTEKDVNEYYGKHKDKIDTEKVDKFIGYVRSDLDYFFETLNAKLREQGMKEIPYRKGYFPHKVEPKQNFIQKLLNWKTQDTEIPTSIAGLTEDFKPVKSYQSFDKQRHSDKTDYDLMRLFQNYKQGALDWIYHLEDIQKRRAVENYIRYTHSEEGIQARIKEVYANENFDADEAQAEIEKILTEAKNPLNNFVQDFTTHTNILAGKKNSLDRTVEQMTNRKIYTVMQNVQNRTSANMVLANIRSALTNFIPITQSWAQVSPLRSLQATKDTIANAIKDDGMVNKSTFLTNRLNEADSLYKTNWDKVLDKAGIMFEVVDNISSQVIWRSKYNQNLSRGMSEAEAIANADQFAENVMAGRSKGNEPTLFNAKNPLVKAFTMFQLEVNNQYGYFLKDVPNDLKAETNHWKLNLAKGYTTAFIGAYVYNALLEQVAGSGAALDPIGIIEDLLRDLGLFDDDEEKEPDEVITNLVDNVIEELPFVGGLFGGGRIPISSAIPYGGEYSGGLSGAIEDVTEGNWKNIGKEMMNPILNVGLPVGGGQLKKTVQGLKMFSDEHPVSGSYTDSGNLRFPVEDTPLNRVQAALFGQYASKNAREYFDNGYAPLKEKQIKEYMDVDLPIADYWKYREGLSGLKTNAEKADYVNSLDIKDWQKNLLMNNILDRKEDVDMSNYDDFGSWEEFDYAQKNPEKYAFSKSVGGYSAYKTYSDELNDIKSDKDESGKSITGSRKEKVLEYINNLDADYETKIILWKSEYPSDDTYNMEIINYINGREDLTYEERVSIFTELGFTVSNGSVYWD